MMQQFQRNLPKGDFNPELLRLNSLSIMGINTCCCIEKNNGSAKR